MQQQQQQQQSATARIDYDALVGRTQLVSVQQQQQPKSAIPAAVAATATLPSTASTASNRPGFHCSLCDKVFMDNLTFMTHLAGKKHQRKLGSAVDDRPSTAAEVRARIAFLAASIRLASAAPESSAATSDLSLKDRVERARAQQTAKASKEREARQQRKKRKREQQSVSIFHAE